MPAPDFDVAIAGAGPGATMCAWACARAGLSVVVFERGDFPGAKAMFGGVLYTPLVARFFPGFVAEGAVERHVVQKRFAMLADIDELALDFRFLGFEPPYYNHSFTALRARFDRWLAAKAEAEGAVVVCQTVVDDVLRENGRVTGLKVRREGGDVRANVVVAADGPNSLVAQRAGLRGELPLSVILGIKEILSLPRALIEDRFNLEGDEGAAIEYLGGAAVQGAMGAAFIYTNTDTLSVGLGCPLAAFKDLKQQPHEMLDRFKLHPAVRRLLRGTKPEEFAAYLIPELAPEHLPALAADGCVVIGGAAGLVNANPIFHEGSNMAMASGLLAAEAIVEAHKQGDFSAAGLARYPERLRESFAWRDMMRYQKLTRMAESHPRLFGKYPYELPVLARTLMTVADDDFDLQVPKRRLELAVADRFLSEIGLFTALRDLIDVGFAML